MNDISIDSLKTVLHSALQKGMTAGDLVGLETEEFEAKVREGEVEMLQNARRRQVGMRFFAGKRSACTSTTDCDPASLEKLAAETAELARVIQEDPFAGLPGSPNGKGHPKLDLFDPSWKSLSVDDRIEAARQAESAAMKADSRITKSEGTTVRVRTGRVFYLDSEGRSGSYPLSSGVLYTGVIAQAADQMQGGGWYTAARFHKDWESPDEIGRKASERAVRRLNPSKIKTCKVPVVFEPQTANTLLRHFCGAASGGSVVRGASFLKDLLGEKVFPAGIRVIDDPLLAKGLGSRPFDGEGISSRKNVVVEDGTLRTFLLDSYTGRKLQKETTASASRSPGEPPSPGPSNLYLEADETHSPEEIIGRVKNGFFVTDMMGFGVNPVTGDFSQGAAGLWIENGEFTHAVEEVTIASNLKSMFAGIEAVGNDIDFRTDVASPTLLISQMTVAGA